MLKEAKCLIFPLTVAFVLQNVSPAALICIRRFSLSPPCKQLFDTAGGKSEIRKK